MMLNGTQLTLGDTSTEYEQFLKKFEPKKTTNDCMTPPNIYEVIKDWAVKEYHLEGREIIRPFWPGGDYERHHYPAGCVVIDNPPFSILAEICRTYQDNGISFFLFAPYLTNLGTGHVCSHIITGSSITYDNGARVDTSFITNLDRYCLRSVPELGKAIKREDDINLKAQRKELPKYKYPDEVVTAAMLGYMAKHGVALDIAFEDCQFIRALESQRASGKTIFGGGYLLGEKAAAEKAAAETWELTDVEREIIRRIGERSKHE